MLFLYAGDIRVPCGSKNIKIYCRLVMQMLYEHEMVYQ